jgi:hypothetical protein
MAALTKLGARKASEITPASAGIQIDVEFRFLACQGLFSTASFKVLPTDLD